MKLLLLVVLPALALALPSANTRNRWYAGECGQSKYSDAAEPFGIAVVGGIDAREHEFPHQAQFTLGDGHWCGGSIINEQWVVTAAHCVVGKDRQGVTLKQHNVDEEAGDEIYLDIEEIFSHEDYPREAADIALLKLATPVSFDEDLQPVCSPDPANDYVVEFSEASGWGALESGGPSPSILQWTSMPIPTNDDCADAQREVGYFPPEATEICAGEIPNHERDTCQGDSGGPLTVREDDRFILVGLTSHGYGCASGAPGIYARVTSFLDWMDDIMANN